MNLILDIGNSAIKYGLFNEDNLLRRGVLGSQDLKSLGERLNPYRYTKVIVSAVTDLPPELKYLSVAPEAIIVLSEKTALPIVNAYLTPQTLGFDRLANACGAAKLFPEKNVLVIDTGTCLKFDFLTYGGQYLGGAISPGLLMRFKALHHFTARLPLLDPGDIPPLIGTNTVSSIQSGVVNGMIAEINEITRQYQEKYPGLEIIITGGHAAYFLNHLKSRIFAAPDLTLQGLNAILLFQAHE